MIERIKAQRLFKLMKIISTLITRVLDNRPMKIDEISDGFCTKIREAGVEDAASERILVQNTPKDIDCHRVLIQNSRLIGLH
jgi:hypothetical protein